MLELRQYLLREYPQENAHCEWKEYKNLKDSFCGDEKNDVVRIYGNEINKRYIDLLKTNDTLSLWDCISLDAV